jgi:hypothetical protein
MYMEVAVRGLQTYLLALPHKDQVHLWLGQLDITAQLGFQKFTKAEHGVRLLFLIQ